MRNLMRRLHYSIHTGRAYCDWAALFVDAEKNVEDFLTHLAIQDSVAVSTQNQAFNALVFLYKRVLQRPLKNVSTTRTRKKQRIPAMLMREGVKEEGVQ